MSVETRAICVRGEFFIRTGTERTFRLFVGGLTQKVRKYIPINKISNLIALNKKDDAIAVWVKSCMASEIIPIFRKKIIFGAFSSLTIVITTTYIVLNYII